MIDPFRALVALSALSQLSELTKGIMQEDTRGEGVAENVAKQTGQKDPITQQKGKVDFPSDEEKKKALNTGQPKTSLLSGQPQDSKASLLGS